MGGFKDGNGKFLKRKIVATLDTKINLGKYNSPILEIVYITHK